MSVKERYVHEKDYIWNSSSCNCKNEKYLPNSMDVSETTCDKIIESYDEETKNIPTNFNEKKATCKTKNLYIFAFLLISITLLIAASDCVSYISII